MKAIFRFIFKLVKYFSIALLILLVAWFSFALMYRYDVVRICAVLPNGLLVGRSSLLSTQNTRMLSDVVLKLPDGTVLVKNKFIEFYFSKTSTFGVAEPRNYSAPPYAFAYRADIGFVRKENSPKKYHSIVREAGPLIREYSGHASLGYASLLHVYENLIELTDFRKEDCPITLFP